MSRTASNPQTPSQARPESGRKIRFLVSALLGWFASNARDLPWRRCQNPYAVWVSEVMLQQTQVNTVIPYWKRWMAALPTVRALAQARPERVLQLWEGLGYYRRARNLRKAAQLVMRKHGGRFPRDFDSVLALPGIGRYTAGAICSIAFNHPSPVVDGNVARVLSRVFSLAGSPSEKQTNHKLWQLAARLVQTASRAVPPMPAERPPQALPANAPRSQRQRQHSFACADLNQALMELGAVVCLPRQPRCLDCPVRRLCLACRTNRVHELPEPRPRPPTVPRHFLAFALEHRGRYLVRQRPPGVVNARLWEFPNVEITGQDLSPARVFLISLGLELDHLTPLLTLRHAITRFRITLEARHARLPCLRPSRAVRGRWLPLERLSRLPFASAHRKILARLQHL